MSLIYQVADIPVQPSPSHLTTAWGHRRTSPSAHRTGGKQIRGSENFVCVENIWKFAETTNYCVVPCKKIKSLGTYHLPILLRIRDTEWYHNHLLRNSELSEFKFEVSLQLSSVRIQENTMHILSLHLVPAPRDSQKLLNIFWSHL